MCCALGCFHGWLSQFQRQGRGKRLLDMRDAVLGLDGTVSHTSSITLCKQLTRLWFYIKNSNSQSQKEKSLPEDSLIQRGWFGRCVFCQTLFLKLDLYFVIFFFFCSRVLQKNCGEIYKWGVSIYKFSCKLLGSENPDRLVCHCAGLCKKAPKFRAYCNLIKINCNEYKEIIEKQKAKVLRDYSYLSLRSNFSTSKGFHVFKIR